MKIILLVLLVIVLALFAGAYIAFFFGVVRLQIKPDPGMSKWVKNYREEIIAGADWFRAQQPEKIEISSFDGLKLAGYFLPAENARGTLLLVHGYRSDLWCDFGIIYPYYHSLGFNILAISQRTHSDSEGRYITFGIKERFDVRDWAVYLYDRFGPAHRVILDGISMGSTSVLMSLGTKLPENVCGVIADCGFTSPYDQFCHMFRARFHLPRHPLMDIAQIFTKHLAGFGYKDYSTLTALQSSTLPVLFFHGLSDTFVPPRFSEENFAACRGEKKLITVPGAGHGGSYLIDRVGCEAVLEEFFDKLAPKSNN